MKIITETRSLKCMFSREEHEANSSEMARLLGAKDEMEETHKIVKSGLNEQMKQVEADLSRHGRYVRDKFDHRIVTCQWLMNNPVPGRKSLVRTDTMDTVEERKMEDHERQESLKFDQPSHILEGPGSLKGKRVDELAEGDLEMFASRDNADLLKFGWIQTDIDAMQEEHRRRAGTEPAAEAPTETPAPEEAPIIHVPGLAEFTAQHDGTMPEPPEMADDTAGCALCDADIPLSETGRHHVDGTTCPVGIRNARIASGEPEDVEAAHTLPSARAVDGPKRTQRRAAAVKPPTAEERAALDQLAAEEQEQLPDYDLRDDAPEI